MAVAYANAGVLTYTGSGTSCTPPLPASVSPGDLLIAAVGAQADLGSTHTWPSGWTKIDGQGYASFAYRVATGSDSAPTVTFATSTSTSQVFRFTGASATPISAARSVATGTTSTTHTSAAVTTTANTADVIYLDISFGATLLTNPSGWTSDVSAYDGSLNAIAVGDKQIATSGTSSGAISTAGGTYWTQWQQEILAGAPTSSATLQTIQATTGTGYSGNVSGAALQTIGATTGTAIAGSAGTSSSTLQTIGATTGTATLFIPGSMTKTRVMAVKAMTGLWQTAKVRQLAHKVMTGVTGTAAMMVKQGQMPVKAMVSWPTGTMAKTGRAGHRVMTGAPGYIGSMAKTGQYGVVAKTGYFNVTATMAKTGRLPIKATIASVGVGSSFVTVAMHTEWQALTTYTNYPFNSFAQFNNVFLGASSAGLFVLSGANDNGVNIDAVARVGVTDFGTSKLKKVVYIYVGYRTTGDCLLRVITNDTQTRDYRMPPTGETGIHVKRVTLGRGVTARYYQFEIQNINGADFELNTMEIKPTILSRRVQGGRA